MKIWKFKFNGMFPVGACGVVLANTEKRAKELVKKRIEREGLLEKNCDSEGNFVVRLEWISRQQDKCYILNSGDY